MKLDSSIAAIVTGAASGLGEATARMLASHGVKVAIFDMNAERGPQIAKEIGGIFARCDVADEASVDAALQQARAAHGIERVLVNCAGIAPAKRTVSRKRDSSDIIPHDTASFTKTMAVNLIGSFTMIAKCAAAMAGLDPIDKDGQRGCIISTASIAATDGQIGQVAYAASKGGVLGMTLPIARDLAASGIRNNTIMPGLFETPMFASVSPEFRQALEASVPFPSRLGSPQEYAKLVHAIIDNDMMNGFALRLDGAVRLAPK